MLQALLADRFGVKIHKETRTLPAFELSVAKGGSKLKDVDVSKLPGMPEPGSAMPPPPPLWTGQRTAGGQQHACGSHDDDD